MWISSGRNIIIDHVSGSWGSDEVISASRDVQNLTVQNTIISEALNRAGHAFGSIIASAHDTTYSWHHNLWANNVSRNPRPGTDAPDPGFRLDLRNNVFSNWGYAAGYSGSDDGPIELNYINNYLVAGPNSTATCAMESGGSLRTYQSGNMIDLNKNGRVDGSNTGWGMFCGNHVRQSSEWPVPSVTTDSAGTAYARVLAQGGAMPWRRDAVDKRIVDSVRQQNGRIINNVSDVGGWPTLVSAPAPTDTDSDGMPDYWEHALGLNPSNAADRNNTDATGYTMLEKYLNWLADGHATVDRNGSVDVDLRTLNGGLALNFTVASGSNGTVTLLGDGRTARFTPAANHSGLANFTYTATDPASGLGFGPVSVGVLVRATALRRRPLRRRPLRRRPLRRRPLRRRPLRRRPLRRPRQVAGSRTRSTRGTPVSPPPSASPIPAPRRSTAGRLRSPCPAGRPSPVAGTPPTPRRAGRSPPATSPTTHDRAELLGRHRLPGQPHRQHRPAVLLHSQRHHLHSRLTHRPARCPPAPAPGDRTSGPRADSPGSSRRSPPSGPAHSPGSSNGSYVRYQILVAVAPPGNATWVRLNLAAKSASRPFRTAGSVPTGPAWALVVDSRTNQMAAVDTDPRSPSTVVNPSRK